MFFKIFTWVLVVVWLVCGLVMFDARASGNKAIANITMVFFIVLPIAWCVLFGNRNYRSQELSLCDLEVERPYEIVGMDKHHGCFYWRLVPVVNSDEDYDPKKHAGVLVKLGEIQPKCDCKYLIPKLMGGAGSQMIFIPFPEDHVHVTETGYKTVIRAKLVDSLVN